MKMHSVSQWISWSNRLDMRGGDQVGSQSPPQFYCTMIMIVKRDEATFPDPAGQLQYYSESWISDDGLGLASDEIFTVTIIWSILDPSLKYKAQPRKKRNGDGEGFLGERTRQYNLVHLPHPRYLSSETWKFVSEDLVFPWIIFHLLQIKKKIFHLLPA